MIYLDHNATTPVLPSAQRAVLGSMETGWGNPSSGHAIGLAARETLDSVRASVAGLAGSSPEEVVFTSGATEAINHAVYSAGPGRYLVSGVEHPAVFAALDIRLNREFEVLPVEQNGRIDVGRVLSLVDKDDVPACVAVMAANNETGIIQPIRELSEALKAREVPLMVDAVQYIGRLPIDFAADYLILTGHKLGGIKGAGALVVQKGKTLLPYIAGGGQEGGRRGGTEPMPALAALGAAMDHVAQHRDKEASYVGALRDDFEQRLKEAVSRVRIVGEDVPRICSTSLVIFPKGTEAEALVNQLALRGVAVSAGSACSTGSLKPSRILTAMGIEAEDTFRAVRFSFGPSNTQEEVSRIIDMLPRLVAKVRR